MSSIESAKTLADQRPINTFHLEMARGYVKDISIVAKQKKKLSRTPYPPTASENLQRDSILVAFWAALFLSFFFREELRQPTLYILQGVVP